MDLGIGVIVGLLLSTIFIVWMTAADHSLRYPQEVAALAGVPVLVSTPHVPALEMKSRRKQGKNR
jgi:capsular polysaccharide biosynthesis protein